MNLFEKMAAVMRDVQYLAKDDHVEFKTTKYSDQRGEGDRHDAQGAA